jgi:hypothetical protein
MAALMQGSSATAGDAVVRRIYRHLGDIRHPSEVVQYRVEQHEERLRDRLSELTGT